MTALQTTRKAGDTAERVRFRVAVHCPQCAATLEQALSTTDGVHRTHVDPMSGDAILEYDPGLVTHRDLQEAIEAAGFDVESVGTWSFATRPMPDRSQSASRARIRRER